VCYSDVIMDGLNPRMDYGLRQWGNNARLMSENLHLALLTTVIVTF